MPCVHLKKPQPNQHKTSIMEKCIFFFYVRKHISYLLTLLPHKWLKHIFSLLQWLPVCVYWSCAKNPKPQVTPWVSVFVISSTLSSGSLKGHFKPGKSTNDVMQTSHVAYCVAQHSILTDSTCFLFRSYYHCITPKIQSCFMYTSLNKDKVQGKIGRQQSYYFKVLENRSDEWCLCGKLKKNKLGEVRFMVPCEILILLLCASRLCSERSSLMKNTLPQLN